MDLRIAVPVKAGCPVFDLLDCDDISIVDVEEERICRTRRMSVDLEDGDRMARQLEDAGVDILIAGGVPETLLEVLNRSRINLVTAVTGETVDALVAAFVSGTL